ncbi:hypothetical protein [Halomonas alimentaria]|uniref:hypothetical protein n=1 Tax=Halomonas alimentaria TaxID=147248 RepID=UPI002490D3E4|nr:hypothetical protein [Halomonas alimentaria]
MPQQKSQAMPARRFWLSGRRAAEQDRFFREALEAQGWEEGDETHWDAAWVTGMPAPTQFRRVSPQRKLNHFPGNAALTVKSRLHDSLAALRALLVDGFGAGHSLVSRLDFFPHAWLMPRDHQALQLAALTVPEARWIEKPTNASKGKGVRVLRDVAEATTARDHLVQAYLDRPHTIRGHKYVLRLYVLIASLTPLRVYLYRQGFAKLASEPWDPEDADNPYSQLTNPDINALNTRAEVPVEFIDLERYRAWLREQGHDDARLFARIEDLVALTAISAVDGLRARSAEVGADPRGGYELLGLDCLVDADLKPWILECNLSPSLGTCAAPEDGGLVEERIKGELVRDMLSLVDVAGDHPPAEGLDAATLLAEVRAEESRAGGFQRLLPADEPERYLPAFSLPSLADLTLAEAVAGRSLPRPQLVRRRVEEFHEEDRLALYAEASGRLYRPNDAAALIWLLATEGLDPDAIAAAFAEASEPPASLEDLRDTVWSTLGEWCREGLLCQGQHPIQGEDDSEVERDAEARPSHWRLRFDARDWSLMLPDAAVERRLYHAFGERLSPASSESAAAAASVHLAVLASPTGYALAEGGRLVASRLTLAEVVPALGTRLLYLAARAEAPVLDLVWWCPAPGQVTLLAFDQTAQSVPSDLPGEVSRGVRLVFEGAQVRLEPLGLPLEGRRVGTPPPLAAGDVPLVVMQGDGEDAGAPRPLARLDALAALLPLAHAPDGTAPSAETMARLDAWLEGVVRHRIDTQAPPEHLAAWLVARGGAPLEETTDASVDA